MKKQVEFKIHTARLMEEIVNCGGQGIYKIPLNVMLNLLRRVAERASQLNDPQLNALMMRLTMFEIADPESKEYDPRFVEEYCDQHDPVAPIREKVKGGGR